MIPDPVEHRLAVEAHADHERAQARGQRVREIANRIVSDLHAVGVLHDLDRARPVIYGALVDALYGNAAVDLDPRPFPDNRTLRQGEAP